MGGQNGEQIAVFRPVAHMSAESQILGTRSAPVARAGPRNTTEGSSAAPTAPDVRRKCLRDRSFMISPFAKSEPSTAR